MNDGRGTTLVLGALCALLTAFISAMLGPGTGVGLAATTRPEIDTVTRPQHGREARSASDTRTPQAIPEIDNFAAFVERPLFRPDRRPYTPEPDDPAETVPAAPARPPSIVVTGIVMANGSRTALLRGTRSGPVTRAMEGDVVDGWRLDTIRNDAVTVTRAGATFHLELRKFE